MVTSVKRSDIIMTVLADRSGVIGSDRCWRGRCIAKIIREEAGGGCIAGTRADIFARG